MNWRTRVNQEIAKDLLSKTYHDIDSMNQNQTVILLSKEGIYQFGITVDQATSLAETDFLNFGLPRARLTREPIIIDATEEISLSDSEPEEAEPINMRDLPDIDYDIAPEVLY